MKNEFTLAFKQVISDRNLPEEIILDALKDAMVSAYRRSVNASSAQKVEAEIDLETGDVTIFAEKEVVEGVQDERTEVELSEAQEVKEDAEPGDLVMVESTPTDFGRVAAQTARQVIQQRIRQAEREAQFEYYSERVGEIVTGVVQAIHRSELTIGLNINAEGIMPRSQQIPKEYFRVHDRIRALLLDVEETTREPKIILSRAHRDFLRRLLENEVPEIYQGLVEIRSIAREAGHRSKVAVAALKPGVDPVGACVGVRGVRIQAIVRELSDEKIDVIEWNPNTEEYIAKALSPARVLSVFLNKDTDGMPTATVVVPEDQLSLAIGRSGQNARLAAKLTGWRIDIKGLFEVASETLFNLQNNPQYALFAEQEADAISEIEAIMTKKAEGRPIQPEEYRDLHDFTERVEKGLTERREKIKQLIKERMEAVEEAVPEDAYDLPLMTLGLPTRVENILLDEGFENVGALAYQLLLEPESIANIEGIGPTYIQQIKDALEVMVGYEPLPEELQIDQEELLQEDIDLEEVEKEIVGEPEEEVPSEEGEEPAPETEEEIVEEEVEKEPEKVSEGEEALEVPIPEDAYDLPLMTLGLPAEVETLLTEEGYENVGVLAHQVYSSPDSLSDIEGLGPDQVEIIKESVNVMVDYEPLPAAEEGVDPSAEGEEEIEKEELEFQEGDE
ncbi:MAG: transcription termination factor NusA [Anaerolineales bacterium]